MAQFTYGQRVFAYYKGSWVDGTYDSIARKTTTMGGVRELRPIGHYVHIRVNSEPAKVCVGLSHVTAR